MKDENENNQIKKFMDLACELGCNDSQVFFEDRLHQMAKLQSKRTKKDFDED